MNEVFDESRFEWDELIDAGDLVVGLGAIRVRGAGSGASASQSAGAVARIHDGRVAEMRIFLDREQTLRAAGLSADGAAP